MRNRIAHWLRTMASLVEVNNGIKNFHHIGTDPARQGDIDAYIGTAWRETSVHVAPIGIQTRRFI